MQRLDIIKLISVMVRHMFKYASSPLVHQFLNLLFKSQLKVHFLHGVILLLVEKLTNTLRK